MRCVERRILTRASLHPTYGERCHPVAGRWFACHIVGQYGRRYDGNLTMKTQFSPCQGMCECRRFTHPLARRILTRASLHPTYGERCHPASGKDVIRHRGKVSSGCRSMVCVSHRRSVWTEVRRESDNWKRSFHCAGTGVSATDFREGHGTSRGCTSSVERRILTRASFHPTYGGILLNPAIKT